MLKRIILACAVASAIFAFSACAPADEESTGAPETSSTQQTDAEMGSEPSDETTIEEVETFISEADLTAYNAAIDLLDDSYCEQISDSSLRSECSRDVKDELYFSDAKVRRDPSFCDRISTEDKQEACHLSLEVAAEREARDVQNANEEDFQLYGRAISENNIDLCDQIENKDVRDSCISYVSTNPPAQEPPPGDAPPGE